MESVPSYITNPQTQKPVRVGSRVYNRLVRQCIVNPDDYAEPLPTPKERGRPRKVIDNTKKSYQLVDQLEDSEYANVDNDEEINQIVKEEEQAQELAYKEAYRRERSDVQQRFKKKDNGFKPTPNNEPVNPRFGNIKKPRTPSPPRDKLEKIDRRLMQKVAACAANSVKKDPQYFEGMTEEQVLSVLKKMIIDELGDSEEDEKSD